MLCKYYLKRILVVWRHLKNVNNSNENYIDDVSYKFYDAQIFVENITVFEIVDPELSKTLHFFSKAQGVFKSI